MTVVSALDLRVESQPVGMPANIEAEHALIGALLYDNAAYERISDSLRSAHFFEPLHQRLFAAIETLIRKGQLAEPILLVEHFSRDPAFEEMGGVRYLADMVDRAPPPANAPDYASLVTELARRRELIRIGGELVKDASAPDENVTSRELIEGAEQTLYSLAETGAASGGFQTAETYLAGAVEMAAKAFAQDGGLSGISTGLIDVDRKTGGLHKSDLIIIAARPSMGKTSLAVNIAFDVAKKYAYEAQPDGSHKTVAGGRVAFFSLEMSSEQLGMRLLSEASGVSGDRLRRGDIEAHEFGRVRDSALAIQSMPLLVDATGGLSMAKLAARARRMKRLGGLDLIVVDYLQLVTSSNRRGEGRVQEVTEVTQGLKALAKDLDVPVIALSQLSRQVENREDKKPQLSDLRESGSIEQDADMVMFLYREEYYLGRVEPKPGTAEYEKWRTEMDACAGVAELIIGKQRHGPIGNIRLHFNEDITTFSNLARESRFEPVSHRLPYGDRE